jgi:hypothetical protein
MNYTPGIILLLFMGCAGTPPIATSPTTPATTAHGMPGDESVQVRGEGWSIAFPTGWMEHPSQDSGSGVVLTHHISPDVGGQFRSNAILARESFDGTLEQYVETSVAMNTAEQATVRSQLPSEVSGLTAVELEADWPTPLVPVRGIQLHAVDGTHGYVITCMGAREHFEMLRSTCSEIFRSASFHFTE